MLGTLICGRLFLQMNSRDYLRKYSTDAYMFFTCGRPQEAGTASTELTSHDPSRPQRGAPCHSPPWPGGGATDQPRSHSYSPSWRNSYLAVTQGTTSTPAVTQGNIPKEQSSRSSYFLLGLTFRHLCRSEMTRVSSVSVVTSAEKQRDDAAYMSVVPSLFTRWATFGAFPQRFLTQLTAAFHLPEEVKSVTCQSVGGCGRDTWQCAS